MATCLASRSFAQPALARRFLGASSVNNVMKNGISLHNVTLAYRGHPAVHHVTGQFEAGSLTALIGPNGAGKSTLVSAIAGHLKPVQGEILFDADATSHRPDIAYLPQQSMIDRSFPVRVRDLVGIGAWQHIGMFGKMDANTQRTIEQAITTVGLRGFEDRHINELSVGQMQRVLFARVLIQDAPIILLDEPFNALDERTIHDLVHVMEHWHHEGRTVVAVLHDFHLVKHHFPESLLLAREVIDWGKTADVLKPSNLERLRQMTESWDENAAWCQRVESSGAIHTHG